MRSRGDDRSSRAVDLSLDPRRRRQRSADRPEAGEICAKGPQVMAGYWQRPEDTANVMTADGYFRTGDIGVIGR